MTTYEDELPPEGEGLIDCRLLLDQDTFDKLQALMNLRDTNGSTVVTQAIGIDFALAQYEAQGRSIFVGSPETPHKGLVGRLLGILTPANMLELKVNEIPAGREISIPGPGQ
jgi:hypothetical protein